MHATTETYSKHRRLCIRAASWLRSNGHCVALVEPVSVIREVPDVIGWKGGISTLIEVKVSRTDFGIDQLKISRRTPGFGVGQYRYYLTPEGMVSPDEMPEGWGLFYEIGQSVREIVRAQRRPDYAVENEIYVLTGALRRLRTSLGTAEFDRALGQSGEEEQ